MGKLILVRHGESTGNATRTFTTSPDAPLTEAGKRQAYEAAARIKGIFKPSLVISSPYTRARQTGEIIAAELHLPIEEEHGLREQSLGHLAGKPYDIVRDDPSFDPARSWLWKPPGGESHEDVLRRVAPVLDAIARKHETDEVVLVSHGGTMRCLWVHAAGTWEGAHVPANCGIVIIEHDLGRYAHPYVLGEGPSQSETGG